MRRKRKRIVGLLFWIATLGAVGVGVVQWDLLGGSDKAAAGGSESGALPREAFASVAQFVTGQSLEFELVDEIGRLRPGDPVFFPAGQAGQFRQVGIVGQSSEQHGNGELQIQWHEPAVDPEECQFFQYHSTGRLSEVVQTMMPEAKRKRIQDRIAVAMAEHGDELSREFVPLVETSLRQSLPVIEEEFRRSVRRHRSDIDSAAARWQEELVQQRLIPLARREILPIVKKHGQPPAEKVGREIWDRASLFRFGWRAMYDKAPLPQKDLVREEWQRFVEEEAVPVLERHMDEIVVAIQRSVTDVAANDAVRRELAEVADEMASDPKSRALVQAILKETFVENLALRRVWRDVWSSRDAEKAFDLASRRMEPIMRGIGDELFGSEEEGIDPDFARVLRSQILRKDRRWVVGWHTGANNGIVLPASDTMPFPVVYVAQER